MSEAILDLRLADVLHVAQQRQASDIHLSPELAPALRVDGELVYLPGSTLSRAEIRVIASALMGDDRVEQIEAGSDISSTWTDGVKLIVRVHGFRVRDGLALALRLLNRSIPTLESLHLPRIVATLAERPRGLIIFAGPTGSGKSTSLAALLARMNASSSRRIITIEDPIEYRHESHHCVISQREVGRDAPDFSSAIIGALRSDPDVIMVGEMRDLATMRAAVTAAETGHLVLTTLHTGDAAQTIDRIIDAFAGSEQTQIRAQLAQVLTAVVCQRLLPRANGPGRRVVAEILIANDAVRNIIRESRTHQLRNVMLTGRQNGMQTLEHHLTELLREREIDSTAAHAITDRADEIRMTNVRSATP